jgi:predicted GIY-YIG superfamily endonuclease
MAKKNKSGYIYGIEHKSPGSKKKKIYVGKTKNLKKRMKQHGVRR